jgi:hypothetical protein
VSFRTLELARERLKLDRLPAKQAERIRLLHGSLIYGSSAESVGVNLGNRLGSGSTRGKVRVHAKTRHG